MAKTREDHHKAHWDRQENVSNWHDKANRSGEVKREQQISFFDHTPRQRAVIVMGIIGLIVIAIICFVFAHYLLSWIYTYTGAPPQVANSVLSAFIGIVITGVVFKLTGDLIQRVRPGANFFLSRSSILARTVETLERISRGEFDASIQYDPSDVDTPFAELAESVNRMASKLGSMESLRQEFVSNVSHEIQSPLTSITGFAELLKKDDLTPQQRNHYIGIIETESRRLSKMSDNLLRLSSLESSSIQLDAQAFRLDEQIERTVLLLEPQWSAKDLDVSLELERKVNTAGDADLLEQVWVNLITNAIKFTPSGGSLSIMLAVSKGVGVSPCAKVSIADTGIGIAPEDQIHLFERFFKVDSSRNRDIPGSGLGLSLVHEIVTLHGGKLDVESVVGEGSTFTVTLPLPQAD